MENSLNEIQIDALREVGNIGAGNAATALSQMLNKKIDMTVPKVNILPFENMLEAMGLEEDMVIAVMLKVFGDAPGNILFVMNDETAKSITDMLLTGYEDVSEEIYYSVYQEIGNILGNSYINAICKLTGLSLLTSVPAIAADMLGAILSSTFIDAEQYSDYVLAIDTNFIQDGKEKGTNFFFIPKPGSLKTILNNLGL
ncbi:chemotaxis protein CheC [Caloramator quimbayensis]|uniref:Chemotaxis protein CheC n=1 Tax=Caloramator quimbayensis TaxID=1147123 RepID=A0A1T4X954_9CLOT|nr:chemotaxis protein CheC [Caloramator quimbayensis]SKA86122.1 chemotaxis protein CheC [Caloramator quimbayensis]